MNKTIERVLMRSLTVLVAGANRHILRTFYRTAIRSSVDNCAPVLFKITTSPRYTAERCYKQVTYVQSALENVQLITDAVILTTGYEDFFFFQLVVKPSMGKPC